MDFLKRVEEEIFNAGASNSDIQDKLRFNYLWKFADSIHCLLFEEFGKEFAVKITLWRDWIEFSYGWRSLEKGRRLTSISHLPKYSVCIFKNRSVSCSLNSFYNKPAVMFLSKNFKKAASSEFVKRTIDRFLKEFPGCLLWIHDSSGKRSYEVSNFNVDEFIKILSSITPSEEYPLKGGDVALKIFTDEKEFHEFFSFKIRKFIRLTKPIFLSFYLPLTEVQPKRKIRSAKERKNWERVKKEILKLENRCQLCGTETPLEVAHIVPFSRGGSDSIDNLLVLCSNCHRKMAPTEPIEVRKRKGKYWISYVDRKSKKLKEKPLIYCNHTIKENCLLSGGGGRNRTAE